MIRLDPEPLFDRLVSDLPSDLHEHIFVVGSLAAAYHFRVELMRQGVNTKDADLVVHPAGDTFSCAAMAGRLLDLEWRPHPDCFASPSPDPPDELRAIRLYPPDSTDYFVEFLNLPEVGAGARICIPGHDVAGQPPVPPGCSPRTDEAPHRRARDPAFRQGPRPGARARSPRLGRRCRGLLSARLARAGSGSGQRPPRTSRGEEHRSGRMSDIMPDSRPHHRLTEVKPGWCDRVLGWHGLWRPPAGCRGKDDPGTS